MFLCYFFFFQAEDGIRDKLVTGVQTCALPILADNHIADLSDKCRSLTDRRKPDPSLLDPVLVVNAQDTGPIRFDACQPSLYVRCGDPWLVAVTLQSDRYMIHVFASDREVHHTPAARLRSA